jgi:lipoprotein signal peptidase
MQHFNSTENSEEPNKPYNKSATGVQQLKRPIHAGGASNPIGRITRHGFVSDFILIRIGPFRTGVFNLADVAIMIAGALIACNLLTRRRLQSQKQ